MQTTFSVLFQTGGTANFQWKRVLDTFATRGEANASRDELIRAGYPAMVYKTRDLDVIGGPDDFAEIRDGQVVFTGIRR